MENTPLNMPTLPPNRHVSSMLANELPMSVDLDEIRQLDKPSVFWTDEQWARNIESEVRERVFYLWSVFEYIQILGWVEHTNDWDWWIEIKTLDGVWHRAECGSLFNGMYDSEGTVYNDFKAASEAWNWDVNKPLMVGLIVDALVDQDPSSWNADYVETEWRFEISQIAEMRIGYDT